MSENHKEGTSQSLDAPESGWSRDFLFITGCQRSGTSAATRLLSDHREISVGMERFKYLRKGEVMSDEFSPELFRKTRFFDYRAEDTNLYPREGSQFEEFYKKLENSYDQAKWVGDKNPSYYWTYKCLIQKFPDCRILVMHRSPYEVAYSWNVRAQSERDKWPEKNGYREAVEKWNLCIEKTLACAGDYPGQFLVVEYGRLFLERGYYQRLLDWLKVSADEGNEVYYDAMLEKALQLKGRNRELESEQYDYVSEHAHLDLEAALLERYAL